MTFYRLYPTTPYPIAPSLYGPLVQERHSVVGRDGPAFDRYCQDHPFWPQWLKDASYRTRSWADEQLNEREATIDTVRLQVHMPSIRGNKKNSKQYKAWRAQALAEYEQKKAAEALVAFSEVPIQCKEESMNETK